MNRPVNRKVFVPFRVKVPVLMAGTVELPEAKTRSVRLVPVLVVPSVRFASDRVALVLSWRPKAAPSSTVTAPFACEAEITYNSPLLITVFPA